MGPSRTLRGMLRGYETDQDGRNVPDAVKDEWTTKRRSCMTPLCKKPPRECTRAEPTRSGRPTNGWDGMPPSHQVLTHNINACSLFPGRACAGRFIRFCNEPRHKTVCSKA
eukprot:scaffold177_cov334-Pavlova_lutheri.AAC.62